MKLVFAVALVEAFVIACGMSAPVRGEQLARPIATPLPLTYAKGATIVAADGLTIVNSGRVNQAGQALLNVWSCTWGGKKGQSALVCEWEPEPEAWIVGQLHVIPVYTGRVFHVTVNTVMDSGAVVASFSSHAPANRVAEHKQPAKKKH